MTVCTGTASPALYRTAAMRRLPGRSCPLHYRYDPTPCARRQQMTGPTTYSMSSAACTATSRRWSRSCVLYAREVGRRRDKRLVFNGDFHWFDADAGSFERIQTPGAGASTRCAAMSRPSSPIGQTDSDAGCGCAYPDWVDDGVVERSNRILQRLRATARPYPALRAAGGPADVAARRRGRRCAWPSCTATPQSLAGWGFAAGAPARCRRTGDKLRGWFDAATGRRCLPAATPACRCSPAAGRRPGRDARRWC